MSTEAELRLAAAEAEVKRARAALAKEQQEKQVRHDNMIGACFHALKAIIRIRDEGYSGEALGRAQSWSRSHARYREDGNYNAMRRRIYNWLVELDLIDPKTGLFKFSQDA